MIDHVLGRPSSKSRRLQVLAVLSFWSLYLYKGDRHGPPGAKLLSRIFSKRLSAWQTVVVTMLYLYAARNFSSLVGLASPEPMANMYDSTYYRATWVLTALDAGFWTAMRIRVKWLRDLASIVFSVFYLFAAERADEKVRKVRSMLTVEHLRVAWNKGTTPYLNFFQNLTRPRFTRWPARQVRIPRPRSSDYTDTVDAWLYYDGPLADLQHHDRLILDIPGGGFVAMDPRCNDDKLMAWAAKSGLPVLSLDYKKAPEFPYPYALNECFDVYVTLVQSRGKCIGMAGKKIPKIILSGDSAGGNLAVATTLMILETGDIRFRRSSSLSGLPAPDGLVCFYPALDMNIGNWMSDEQMSLIRDRNMRKTNRSIVRRKSRQYNDLVGTPHHSDDEDESPPPKPFLNDRVGEVVASPPSESPEMPQPEFSHSGPRSLHASDNPSEKKRSKSASYHAEPMKTRLATSSMISYFNDRVLTPEMMRAMIILYIGPHNRPDFSADYLLSPVLAPEALLVKFPKTYFLTGERDPLVDDTVVFAGRLRRAKEANERAMTPGGAYSKASHLEESDAAEVILIPGVSHGFLQFPTIYPPAWKHFSRCVEWFHHIFDQADLKRDQLKNLSIMQQRKAQADEAKRNAQVAESSGDDDRPLEIGMTKLNRGRSTSRGQNGNGPREDRVDSQSPPLRLNGRRAKKGLSKSKSLVKLKSTDDLLERRMEGLAGGLTGMGDDE